MKATIEHHQKKIIVDLSKPLDLSIPYSPLGPRAWYVDPMQITPVKNEVFNGSVTDGGAVNFRNIFFNPHGHGTHTECVGHISEENFMISRTLQQYFFIARVISIKPEISIGTSTHQKKGDHIITVSQIEKLIGDEIPEAVIIRTLPNHLEKLHTNYSNTNFCYLEAEALTWLAQKGVEHLLVDLPSIDREEDGGILAAHHAFWQYPHSTRITSSITEFIFVPDVVEDGEYLLNLQVTRFDNDAAPSRPILFKILETGSI